MIHQASLSARFLTHSPSSPVRLLRLALLGGLVFLMACGGGGEDRTAEGTGSVGLVLTDGPVDSDEFQKILVTFTEIVLIGDSGHFTIFEDARGKTVDLRELEDVSKLVAVGRDVPARTFSKIRLVVTEIELVPADGRGSIFPKLPPKLDLNARQTLRVRPGQLLLVQVDMDANKSIHIVETGSGKYVFRPVVFVDVIRGPILGKLVLLEGEVRDLDLQDESFLLCNTHSISRPYAGDRITEHPEERPAAEDFCVEVLVLDDTSIFDENGDPAELSALSNGDDASVLGRFARGSGEALVFEAEVIQQGSPGTAWAIDGVVLSPVTDSRFDMDVDAGQGFVPGTQLAVELQAGTKIFSRRGQELMEDDIGPDLPVRSVGVLVIGVEDFLKASVIVLDLESATREKVFGEIVSKESAGARIELRTADDQIVCADISEQAEVFLLVLEDDGGSFEMIDRADLTVGDDVAVFGLPDDSDGCLDAEKVIVFADAMNGN